MKQNSKSNGLALKERGWVWKVKVKVVSLEKSVTSRNWKIKVILN